MPRRIPNYPDGYMPLNGYMTYGSILTVISFIFFIYMLIVTFKPLQSESDQGYYRLNYNHNTWS